LNRPEAMNAMNTQMFIDLRAAMRELAVRADARVLVITGAGERAFSVGGDLKERNGMSDETWRAQHQLIEEAFLAVKDFALPVIAAVEGHAHGGGLELALMCDFIVADETARFGQPELAVGIMPGAGGTQRLVRSLGKQVASMMLLTGEQLTGARAFQLGLVAEMAEPGQTLTRALALAAKAARMPPKAVAATRRVLRQGADLPLDAALALENREFLLLFDTADKTEGMSAFLDKRKPQFKGS
jgi:enoyl-CoA hydratase/carnithine racemase